MTDTLSCEEAEILSDPESDLIERAMAHYHRECIENGWLYQQPSSSSYTYQSSIYEDAWDGDRHTYVVLENVNGVLVVYRHGYDGRIESVDEEDWPEWLKLAEDD